MGASMGGVIAQIIAVVHPHRVRSLVLACTACRHLPWRRELLEDWADDCAEAQGMRAFATAQPSMAGRLRGRCAASGPRSACSRRSPSARLRIRSCRRCTPFSTWTTDFACCLPTVTAPTLVLVGSQDILTPQADAEEIVELIPELRARRRPRRRARLPGREPRHLQPPRPRLPDARQRDSSRSGRQRHRIADDGTTKRDADRLSN